MTDSGAAAAFAGPSPPGVVKQQLRPLYDLCIDIPHPAASEWCRPAFVIGSSYYDEIDNDSNNNSSNNKSNNNDAADAHNDHGRQKLNKIVEQDDEDDTENLFVETVLETLLPEFGRFAFPDFDESDRRERDYDGEIESPLNMHDIYFLQAQAGFKNFTFSFVVSSPFETRIYGHVRRYLPVHPDALHRSDVGRRGERALVIVTRAPGADALFSSVLKTVEVLISLERSFPEDKLPHKKPVDWFLHQVKAKHEDLAAKYETEKLELGGNAVNITIQGLEFNMPPLFSEVDTCQFSIPTSLLRHHAAIGDWSSTSVSFILPLLRNLGIQHSLKLMSALLSECRVIMISSNPLRLASCARAAKSILLQGLLYWSHAYFPILPTHLWDSTLYTHKPYIVGILSSFLSKLNDIQDMIGEFCLVDLDRNTVETRGNAGGQTIPDLFATLSGSLGSRITPFSAYEVLVQDLVALLQDDKRVIYKNKLSNIIVQKVGEQAVKTSKGVSRSLAAQKKKWLYGNSMDSSDHTMTRGRGGGADNDGSNNDESEDRSSFFRQESFSKRPKFILEDSLQKPGSGHNPLSLYRRGSNDSTPPGTRQNSTNSSVPVNRRGSNNSTPPAPMNRRRSNDSNSTPPINPVNRCGSVASAPAVSSRHQASFSNEEFSETCYDFEFDEPAMITEESSDNNRNNSTDEQSHYDVDVDANFSYPDYCVNEIAEKKARVAFASFFLCMYGNTSWFLDNNTDGHPHLDREKFLEEKRSQSDGEGTVMWPLMQNFCRTKLFQDFAHARIEEMKYLSPDALFFLPDAPLFLQCEYYHQQHDIDFGIHSVRRVANQMSQNNRLNEGNFFTRTFSSSSGDDSDGLSHARGDAIALTSKKAFDGDYSNGVQDLIQQCRMSPSALSDVISVVWLRLRDSKGLHWQHGYKALDLLYEIICHGPLAGVAEAFDLLEKVDSMKTYDDNFSSQHCEQNRESAIRVYKLLVDRSKLFHTRRVCANNRRMSELTESTAADTSADTSAADVDADTIFDTASSDSAEESAKKFERYINMPFRDIHNAWSPINPVPIPEHKLAPTPPSTPTNGDTNAKAADEGAEDVTVDSDIAKAEAAGMWKLFSSFNKSISSGTTGAGSGDDAIGDLSIGSSTGAGSSSSSSNGLKLITAVLRAIIAAQEEDSNARGIFFLLFGVLSSTTHRTLESKNRSKNVMNDFFASVFMLVLVVVFWPQPRPQQQYRTKMVGGEDDASNLHKREKSKQINGSSINMKNNNINKSY